VGGYYRSQFLNATLPGGVLGDVHRGLRHGRAKEDLSRGLRSVAWERTAGQTVQIALTAAILLAFATPLVALGVLAAGLAAAAVAAALRVLGRGARPSATGSTPEVGEALGTSNPPGRLLRAVTGDLRHAVLTRQALPGIVLASTLVLAGHVAVFAVAVRSTGTEVPVNRLLPLALVVLQAAAVPANVAGWGPREGASAWAFGAAGVGAAAGVTVAVVYGVLALLATVPGAVLLVADRRGVRHRGPRGPVPDAPPAQVVTPAGQRGEGDVHA
jgi:glycosyltransferase 2 family protein